MAMVVNHNLPATNAYRHLGINNSKMSKSIEKLSSGLAINRAGDDAAGLAVSEKMRAQISGLNQAVKNAQDGISMVQTYEGALTETDSILQRMRTLAAQSANGTYQDDVDREAIQLEFDQLNDELNQIADTDFNGVVVLNGGQMADGLKAAAGEFDYANSTRAAGQIGSTGSLLVGLGTDGNTTTDATAGTVTFTATKFDNGKVCWQANSGAKGTAGDGVVASTTEPSDTAAKSGGFVYNGVTVNIDTTQVVTGDTITIKFAPKEDAEGVASEISGSTSDWGSITKGNTSVAASLDLTGITAPTSEEIKDAMNYLNKITIEQKWTAGATPGTDAGTVSESGVKVNGTTIDVTAANNTTTLKSYDDGSEIFVKCKTKDKFEGSEIYFKDKNGNETKLGALKSGKDTAGNAGDTITGTGTVKTTIYTTMASFTPASKSGVEVIEPNNAVSKSNSNDASTATLTYTDNITLQVGARTKDSVNFTFKYNSDGLGELKADLDCSARGLGTDKLSLATQKSANAAIDKIDNAINKVSMVRGSFGAMQNRLEHKVDNLNVASENLTAAESAIRDTDMAKEMMNFTKSQILSQASQAMLAQANQLPQGVLQLLQ